MSQLTVIQLPQAHELSGLASLRESDSVLRQYRRANVSNVQERSMVQELNNALRKIEKMRRRIVGGGTGTVGVQWQSPNKELDPRVAVSVNTWVYISALNPLATVGIIDADSGLLVTAPPGKWLTLQDVPALISGGTYHMPQLPYPGATGEVSGTPIAGDLDNNPLVYWVLESPAPACFS